MRNIKLSFFSVFLLFGYLNNVFAEDCVERICVGDEGAYVGPESFEQGYFKIKKLVLLPQDYLQIRFREEYRMYDETAIIAKSAFLTDFKRKLEKQENCISSPLKTLCIGDIVFDDDRGPNALIGYDFDLIKRLISLEDDYVYATFYGFFNYKYKESVSPHSSYVEKKSNIIRDYKKSIENPTKCITYDSKKICEGDKGIYSVRGEPDHFDEEIYVTLHELVLLSESDYVCAVFMDEEEPVRACPKKPNELIEQFKVLIPSEG